MLEKVNVIFIMGVSGVGKSTIASKLSDVLKIPFFDGDDFHSKSNIKKMSHGKPLSDADRLDWLKKLNDLAKKQPKKQSCIIVCSALKESYRHILTQGLRCKITWVHLAGSFDVIASRMKARLDHFMPTTLLKSQFDILETPKDAITISINQTPNTMVKRILENLIEKSEFGLLGLGVMGKSLSRNLANNKFRISLFNRHVDGIEEDVALNFKRTHPELSKALPFDNIAYFVHSIKTPRKIMLMVNAGNAVDEVIEDLLPHLSKGDILIDGGNSNYKRTNKRIAYLKSKDIYFIGSGISGGEEGALKGPAIMPGGSKTVYQSIAPFLNTIAAKDKNNLPCCTYIGKAGSGHFVKMVHNGVEYVEMQLIAEVYSILKALDKNPDEIAKVLETWQTEADSYLLQITVAILRKKENKDWLINTILDKAGNKGTGNWSTVATTELGVSSTLIATALFARYTSFYKNQRTYLNKLHNKKIHEPKITIEELCKAYQFARIINHYQGFKLISEASEVFKWGVNLSEIARIWTNGCIIRSTLMEDLVEALKENNNILYNAKILERINTLKSGVKNVVAQSVMAEIAIPCLSESINFYNAITTANSPANLIQAQRDYFGAHKYQRINDPTEGFYHTKWN